MAHFTWTDAKRQAVELTLRGDLNQRQIAARVGTTAHTVEGWMRRPAVRAELERRRQALLEAHLAPPSPAQRAALEAEAQAEAEAWVARRMTVYRAYRRREMLPEPHDAA
jgi:transposase-like protein